MQQHGSLPLFKEHHCCYRKPINIVAKERNFAPLVVMPPKKKAGKKAGKGGKKKKGKKKDGKIMSSIEVMQALLWQWQPHLS